MSDNLDLMELQSRLEAMTRKIIAMAEPVSKAKQIRDYDSDRRKQALALGMTGFLSTGDSAAKAECMARASKPYADMIDTLGEQLRDAERVIHEYEGIKCAWDACRTLISMNKVIAGQL